MSIISNYIAYKIENDVTLQSLIGSDYYPQIAPQTESRPILVYTVISTVPVNTKSEGSTLDAIRVQFTILCDSNDTYNGQSKIDEIGEAVRALFEFIQNDTQQSVTIQQSFFQSEFDSFDQTGGQDGTYMKYQDFIFWKTR